MSSHVIYIRLIALENIAWAAEPKCLLSRLKGLIKIVDQADLKIWANVATPTEKTIYINDDDELLIISSPAPSVYSNSEVIEREKNKKMESFNFFFLLFTCVTVAHGSISGGLKIKTTQIKIL